MKIKIKKNEGAIIFKGDHEELILPKQNPNDDASLVTLQATAAFMWLEGKTKNDLVDFIEDPERWNNVDNITRCECCTRIQQDDEEFRGDGEGCYYCDNCWALLAKDND